MKFCKKYEAYMKQQRKQLPGVGLKKLKKILKRCRRDFQGDRSCVDDRTGVVAKPNCPDHCPVCDGTFFPSLLQEMSAVVGCFNERAKKLLEQHLASGFQKCFFLFKNKLQGHHVALTEEGRNLVSYAVINAVAIRKILKKYDKVHYSKQGQAFKSQAQSMHVEILQSPWLCQLMAFHINMKESKEGAINVPGLFEDCSLLFDGGKPSLSCTLFDSIKVDADLTCPICLEMVFDPVSLTCGHIFCHLCACSAASVSIVDGIKAASSKSKCPICRQRGVYGGAIHLEELNRTLNKSCPKEIWEERSQSERIERMKQVKEYWQSQTRLFTGI